MQDLSITLVQTDLIWEDSHANLRMLDQKLGALEDKTDIIVLPEMFTTGFSMNAEKLAVEMNDASVLWMKNKSEELDCVLIGSMVIKEAGNYYNRLFWTEPGGNLSYYDKRHLFSMAGEEKVYTAGAKKLIKEYKGWKIHPMICYDLRFPVWIRNVEEYDLLIFVANWPEKRINHWRKLLAARAIENQCYVVGVNRVGEDGNGINYNGYSMAIDPTGDNLAEIIAVEDVATLTLRRDEITKSRRYMPFLSDKDNFELKF